jgi:hypothetical protein
MILPKGMEGIKKNVDQKRACRFLLVVCVLIAFSGCTPQAYRSHPEFEKRAKNQVVLGLMPSEVKIYEVSGVGLVELRDDWSIIGKRYLVQALKENLKERGYRVRLIIVDSEIEEEINEIEALYRSVNKSIRLHTYGPQVFPEKKKNFRYSLGPVGRVLKKFETDSLVFVHCVDHVLEAGEEAVVSVAVADSSGTIIWYCVKGFRGENWLRDPNRAAEMVESILAEYPEVSG